MVEVVVEDRLPTVPSRGDVEDATRGLVTKRSGHSSEAMSMRLLFSANRESCLNSGTVPRHVPVPGTGTRGPGTCLGQARDTQRSCVCWPTGLQGFTASASGSPFSAVSLDSGADGFHG